MLKNKTKIRSNRLYPGGCVTSWYTVSHTRAPNDDGDAGPLLLGVWRHCNLHWKHGFLRALPPAFNQLPIECWRRDRIPSFVRSGNRRYLSIKLVCLKNLSKKNAEQNLCKKEKKTIWVFMVFSWVFMVVSWVFMSFHEFSWFSIEFSWVKYFLDGFGSFWSWWPPWAHGSMTWDTIYWYGCQVWKQYILEYRPVQWTDPWCLGCGQYNFIYFFTDREILGKIFPTDRFHHGGEK